MSQENFQEPTWKDATTVWWAMTWRALLMIFLVSFIYGALSGVFSIFSTVNESENQVSKNLVQCQENYKQCINENLYEGDNKTPTDEAAAYSYGIFFEFLVFLFLGSFIQVYVLKKYILNRKIGKYNLVLFAEQNDGES